jgi:SagB-type dehydrogenase family enzyme
METITTQASQERTIIYLPLPKLDGRMSLEKVLAMRRSVREYSSEPLTLSELSQLLWATYGVTEPKHGFKTTPSAGATFPLVIYVVVKPNSVRTNSGFLDAGSYRYDPHTHSLALVKRGNLVRELYKACLRQAWVLRAPVNIVIAAVYERTTGYYGERGRRYVIMEVGHASQNLYLQATALGLGTVAVGAFKDEQVKDIVGLRADEEPLYIMPVGKLIRRYSLKEKDLLKYIEENRRLHQA